MNSEQTFEQRTDSLAGATAPAYPRRAGDRTPRLPYQALTLACSLAALAAGCSARSGASRAAATEPRTYTNPVYRGSMPDPSVIRFQGWYYAFGTTGNERTPDGRVFTMLRSRNLVEWENLGGALVPPSPNRRVQYWAPEITHDQGTFYLYYAMGGIEPEKFELRVATNRGPEGPYVDTGHTAGGLRDKPVHH